MSNYKELRTISKKYIRKEVYSIAHELDIPILDETACNKLFKSNSPLSNQYAVLVTVGNRYTIYFKESKHKEYYILHELCHYLLKHNADGEYEENQSNILACMILIPDKSINNDVFDLSEIYNIPVDKVILYIQYIKSNTNIYNKRKVIVFTSFTIAACVLFVSGILLGAFVINNKTSDITPVAVTDTETTSEQPIALTTQAQSIDDDTVYITKYGIKYHKENCYYIKNSETITLTVEQAKQQGYSPCAVCIGD